MLPAENVLKKLIGIWAILFYSLFSFSQQNFKLGERREAFRKQVAKEIIYSDDSYFYLLRHNKSAAAPDFEIETYTAGDLTFKSSMKLGLDSLHGTSYNLEGLHYKIFYVNHHINLITEKITNQVKVIYATSADLDSGRVHTVELDRMEIKDKGLERADYEFKLTADQSKLLVIADRKYYSGYERYACKIIDLEKLSELAAFQLPKLNRNKQTNEGFEADDANQLYYFTTTFTYDNTYQKYFIDSVLIVRLTPNARTWYYQNLNVKPLLWFSNFSLSFFNKHQYVVTALASDNPLSDKLTVSNGGFYYNKLNSFELSSVFDSVFYYSEQVSRNLTYIYSGERYKDAGYKTFAQTHMIMDPDQVIQVYERKIIRNNLVDFLEILGVSFHPEINSVQWQTLIPRKTIYLPHWNKYNIEKFDICVENGNFHLFFLDNPKNVMAYPNRFYIYPSLSQISSLSDANYIHVTIDKAGIQSKSTLYYINERSLIPMANPLTQQLKHLTFYFNKDGFEFFGKLKTP